MWGIPAFLILAVIGFIFAKMAIDAYLRSDGFRLFVAKKAGDTLRSQCDLAPLQFTGLNAYTDEFKANGSAEAPFAQLSLEQFRAEISLRRFFEHVWQVEQVDVQKLRVNFEGPRVDLLEPAPSAAEKTAAVNEKPGWLPNRVEIGSASVHDTSLLWKGGSLHGTFLKLTPNDGGWNIEGSSGKIEQEGLPPLDVQKLRLLARGQSVFIKEAEFRQGNEGAIKVTGEVGIGDHLDIQTAIENMSLTPFLSGDWRVRLKGNVSGEVKVRSPLPVDPAGLPYSGTLRLTRGELTALPVLDQIATFTALQQFRHLMLTRAEGDFQQDGKKLQVSKFVMESEGLIRIEGAFTVENSMIDGSFQLGVIPTSLQWLPGSRTKVFIETRGGYVWSPMRLSGPVSNPKEDLTPRLIAAMQGAVIEGAQNAVEQGVKTGRDAIKGALDLLK